MRNPTALQTRDKLIQLAYLVAHLEVSTAWSMAGKPIPLRTLAEHHYLWKCNKASSRFTESWFVEELTM